MDRLTDLREELMRDDVFRESYDARTALVRYGHMVRRAREARQLTQAELAGLLNTTETGIRRLETGEGDSGPTLEMRMALAHALGSAPLAPTERQWDQARLRIKNVIEGPNTDIDRMIEAVLETGTLPATLKAEFPLLARNELAQRVVAAVRAAIPS